jgi:hypothetical protein
MAAQEGRQGEAEAGEAGVRSSAVAQRLRLAWRLGTSGGVPARSLKVAVVVGTALNLINQGDALFGEAEINWAKLALTFAMPYAVSTYGAVAVRWDARD